ncbi:MAG: ComF family protein [Holosporaceae bacterium]|nr:ComF family protein [Holosporaceae bacterium]
MRLVAAIIRDACFPVVCCSCMDPVDTEGLCPKCWSMIRWITNPRCCVCGVPFEFEVADGMLCPSCLRKKPHFDRAIAAFEYDDFSRNLILKFKHLDVTLMAKKLAGWIYAAAAAEFRNADLIIPTPMHFFRRLMRRYNQSELLALELKKLSGLEYEPRILRKIRRTPRQEGLSRAQRLKNVRGSFGLDEKYVSKICGRRVILVDDVLTTGSTANECAKLLKKHGAAWVSVVTAARVDI